MTPLNRRITIVALIISLALPAWGEQYLLYTPQPVTSDQATPSQDGILVKEIKVRRGDSLYKISRKFSGHGMYFPQILLFNSIQNPNLIYAGKTLKVPLSKKGESSLSRVEAQKGGAAYKIRTTGEKKTSLKTEDESPVRQSSGASPVPPPTTELTISELKASGAGKSKASRLKKNTAEHAKKDESHDTTEPSPQRFPAADTTVPAADLIAGQKLFEAAVKAYRQDDCRTALDLLDRYLADNSGSPLAADANLYKAECYLKLSAQ